MKKPAKAPRSHSEKTRAQHPPPAAPTPNSDGPEQVPPQWAWHHRTLLHLRDRLLRAQAEHAATAASPSQMLGVDVVDTAQERIDRDLLWAELGAESDQLFEVDCALQRIRDGLYGICEETGAPIPPDRLRAVPWTRYVRTAAEQHEAKTQRESRVRTR
ncbi:MAG TPA: TraR/DksA family transcriptional regulator [Opitutus sp.]|nr:TraR/DksA family transcriptional regulator [Opitutus sp.]